MLLIVRTAHILVVIALFASCGRSSEEEPTSGVGAASPSPESVKASPEVRKPKNDEKPVYDRTWCAEPCRFLSQLPFEELQGPRVRAVCGQPLELEVTGCESIDFFQACVSAQTGADVEARYLANFELESWYGQAAPKFDPTVVAANRNALTQLKR